jgi:hypothetical protein
MKIKCYRFGRVLEPLLGLEGLAPAGLVGVLLRLGDALVGLLLPDGLLIRPLGLWVPGETVPDGLEGPVGVLGLDMRAPVSFGMVRVGVEGL